MADGQHNPSRRALLGAAVGVPFSLLPLDGGDEQRTPCPRHGCGCPGDLRTSLMVGVEVEPRANSPTLRPWSESTPTLPSPIKGEGSWDTALAAFRTAQRAVWRLERASAGGSVAEEAAWLPAYEAACAAMDAALDRAMAAPAPGLGALGVKLELFLAHSVEPDAADEAAVAALIGDARRLLR